MLGLGKRLLVVADVRRPVTQLARYLVLDLVDRQPHELIFGHALHCDLDLAVLVVAEPSLQALRKIILPLADRDLALDVEELLMKLEFGPFILQLLLQKSHFI